MNNLQQKEFELLKCFIQVCEKLNITYFLVCGSALGAVKYNGFIPWDDDMDVGLYREDYNRFLKEAQSLLPTNVFLQTYETDPNYPNIFAKLRASDTTYIEKSMAKLKINHGVYIDVFPLDGYPLDKKEQRKLERKKNYYKQLLSCVYDAKRSLKGTLFAKLMRFCGVDKKTAFYLKKYEKLISAYPVHKSEVICNHGNWQGQLEYAKKEQYGKGEVMTFEGLSVTVPQLYDEYLAQKYGDWRADLPKEEQIGHHFYSVCDLSKPYTEYLS